MRKIGDHVAAARAVVAALTRCWTDDDPEHAGCVVTAAPFDEAGTAWFAGWADMAAEIETQRGNGGAPAVAISVDARAAARQAATVFEAVLMRSARSSA